jgi:hypothetical protein
MPLTLTSRPRWLLGGSLYSNLLASDAPHPFRLERRDFAINSITTVAGKIQINVTWSGVEFVTGDTIYICYLGWFDGPAKVVSVSGANILTDVAQDPTASRALYYVNSARPDYRVEVRITDKGPDGGGTLVAFSDSISSSPAGDVYFDPSAYVRRIDNRLPSFPGAGWESWDDAYRYRIEFRERYAAVTGSWIDGGTFASHYAGLGSTWEGSENLSDGLVIQNALPESSKPRLGNALPTPRAFVRDDGQSLWPLPFRVILDGNQAADPNINTFTFVQRERTPSGAVDRTNVAQQFYPGNYWFWAFPSLQTIGTTSLQFWAEMGTAAGGGETDNGGGGPAFAATITPTSGTTVWRWPDGTTTTSNAVSESAAGLPGVFAFNIADPVNLNGMTFAAAGLVGPFSLAWVGARLASLTITGNTGLTALALPGPDMSAAMATIVVTGNTALELVDASQAWLGGSVDLSGNAIRSLLLNTGNPYEDPLTLLDLSDNDLGRGDVAAIALGLPRLGYVNGCAVDLSDNAMPAWMVDAYLNQLRNVMPGGYTGRTINIAGSNAAPTADSASALAILAARGVTVTTT